MKTKIITADKWVKETEKAHCIIFEGLERWIPKSVIVKAPDDHYAAGTAWEIQDWFLNKMDQVGATFSDDGKHRYQLWRIWNERKKQALCIGLNPSTANKSENDTTISRLCQYLDHLNYGGLRMCNLFTYISTDPSALILPEAKGNIETDLGVIFANSLLCQEVVFCWGGFMEGKDRAQKLIEFYPDAKCFGKTISGDPWHPLACFYSGWKQADAHLFKFSEHDHARNIDKRKKRTTRVNHDNAQVPLKFSETNALQRMR